MIDFRALFDAHRISWGRENAGKGNISIKCPLCGAADQGYHLEVRLADGAWKCWRNPNRHKGRNVALLLSLVLGIDRAAAEQLLGYRQGVSDIADIVEALQERRDLIERPETPDEAKPIKMPREFRPVAEGRFEDYLLNRGFDWKSLPAMVDDFDLRGCMSGRYRFRLVIPIYADDYLVGWTARDISNQQHIRYSSLSNEPEAARPYDPAPVNIKSTLLHFDSLVHDEGKGLFVVEGPLDAIKLDWYARPFGYRAVPLYGLAASDDQLALLDRLRLNYDHLYSLFDPGAEFSGLDLSGAAPDLHFEALTVPDGIEDPGAMSPGEVEEFCHCVADRLSGKV